MAFVQVVGNNNFKAWDKWANGDFLVGKVVNFIPDRYGNMAPVILVSENGHKENGPSVGSTFNLNSCGSLKKADLQKGDEIKVVYCGQQPGGPKSRYPGKLFHKVDVFKNDPNIAADAPVSTEDTSGL